MLRATIKSLLSRKLRLVLSGLAVVLGVMFVAGSLVITDTLGRSFDRLLASAYDSIDVDVRAAPKVHTGGPISPIPANLLAEIRSTPGVASATGVVQVNNVRVIGTNGKVVSVFAGTPRFGTNWTGADKLSQVRQGRVPQADNEIAINAALARSAGYQVGDRVGVLTREPKKTFTLVGIIGYAGGQDSIGGAQQVVFTEPVAQELLLGGRNQYSNIVVDVAAGVSPTTVRDRLAATVGSEYQVQTGKERQASESKDAKAGLSFLNKVFLGFAGISLFVGVFLILNTFSIIVAQRTKELALLRAIGGSRRQMIGSVLVEALAIGLLASLLGLASGVGVGSLLAYVFGHLGGLDLPSAGVSVPPSAVIASFAVGILVTLVAAVLPALRASRIPPVAALQEVATQNRPLTRLTVAGGLLGTVGGGMLWYGLSGKAHSNTLIMIMVGVLLAFVGVALLTPVLARPVASVVGRLFSFSVAGRLGRRNAARNPRRTAITAAALMVGVAIITGVNVIMASTVQSMHKGADTDVKADLIISGDSRGLPPTFDLTVLDNAGRIPGVRDVAGIYGDTAQINGEETMVSAATDLPALAQMFTMRAAEGTLRTLGTDELVLDSREAKSRNLHAGNTVQVQLAHGELHTMTVVGVYSSDTFLGWLLNKESARDFSRPQPSMGYLRLTDSSKLAEVRGQVDKLLADSPEVSVGDRDAFIAQKTKQLDTITKMIQVLLALAILIAVLGVVNTLALSVLERTRELGMLRSIGLLRGQTMRMVTVEAVVISVFGALLGMAVGSGLGAATVRALKSYGLIAMAFPWDKMAAYLVLAAIVGVVAGILPAIRAARINVLAAIAHE
jgi:putative ABC transport system permease protein